MGFRLFVGDIVKVKAIYNRVKRSWVASSVRLVRRDNEGYHTRVSEYAKLKNETAAAGGSRQDGKRAKAEVRGRMEEGTTKASGVASERGGAGAGTSAGTAAPKKRKRQLRGAEGDEGGEGAGEKTQKKKARYFVCSRGYYPSY